MMGAIDRGTLDRLIALGRSRGELTAEELRAVLPVDSMDVDALVLVMLELEEAGVSVEPEAFGPRADRPVPLAPDLPSSAGGARPLSMSTVSVGSAAMTAQPTGEVTETPEPAGDPGDRIQVDRIVLLSGLAAFLVLVMVLILL